MASAWNVSGSYCETCNCEAACPCVMLSPPTEDDCTVLVAWHIDSGRYDGQVLDGLNAALLAYAPGHMTKVKWKVALYVDDRGNQAQRDALTKIFSGQAGGPPAALGSLVGEVLGVKAARIDFRADGKKRSVRIEGVGESEIEAIAGQGGKDVTIENHPLTPVPGVAAVVARSNRAKIRDHGLVLDASGKNGFFSRFEYRP